jgi:hypothetical protein
MISLFTRSTRKYENLESAQDIEYVDLTEINNKPIYQCWGDKITHIWM